MRVALTSYPMLEQRPGGLQIQLAETVAALNRLGISARPLARDEKLSDYNLVHIFSCINGNHRIAEQAADIGVPTVTSPLLRPFWTRALARRARILEAVVGRLTDWHVKTEYAHIHSCLHNSSRLVALGPIEKRCIVDAFGFPESRVDVIPNGIPARFFAASPTHFVAQTGINGEFVLNVATVSGHKNQLLLAEALRAGKRKLVVVGPCPRAEQAYLDSLRRLDNVVYLGALAYDSPLLASAYAAASVFCLPSKTEVMPLSVLESLAAGVPVVMTKHHCMAIASMSRCVTEVEPTDPAAMLRAIEQAMSNRPGADQCKESVAQFTWDSVARQLRDSYEAALDSEPKLPA